jgi:hypothetical protein
MKTIVFRDQALITIYSTRRHIPKHRGFNNAICSKRRVFPCVFTTNNITIKHYIYNIMLTIRHTFQPKNPDNDPFEPKHVAHVQHNIGLQQM